jgi:hypothetical protein
MDLEYRTRNLGFAAFLLARNAPIPDIRGKRGAAEFVFADEQGSLGAEWREFQADTPVPVQQYLWAHREIRAQMERKFGPRQ